MRFDPEDKVIIDTMNRTEAKAFVKFLESEVRRHWADISNAMSLIQEVKEKFKL
jgi:hypothetical protein